MSRKAKSCILWRCLPEENRQDSAPGEQAVLDRFGGTVAGLSSGSQGGSGCWSSSRDHPGNWLLFTMGDHNLRAAC